MRRLTLAATFLGLTGVILTVLYRVVPRLAARPDDTAPGPSSHDAEIIDVTTEHVRGEHLQPVDLRRGTVIDLTDAAMTAARSDDPIPPGQS